MGRGISTLLLAIILLSIHGVVRSAGAAHPDVFTAAPVQLADTDLLVPVRNDIVLPPANLPALPEPAIVIMMLLGMGVIGYRARRDELFR